MKLFFKLFIFLIFFFQPALSKEFFAEYQIKTKGIKIGHLVWKVQIIDDFYETSIELTGKGVFSRIFSFDGQYGAAGKIQSKKLIPQKYSQKWVTSKKKRNVELLFNGEKISKIILDPAEKEFSRVRYNELKNYMDPLTSFLNILLGSNTSNTVDGRRVYTMELGSGTNQNRILIKKYTNIWADHKRNDLEYIDIYKKKEGILPSKINIKFKGNLFILNKI